MLRATHPFISTEYLSQLIELLSKQGITPQQLARGTGLTSTVLVSPKELISPLQYHKVIENALMLSKNPLLGLQHGFRMNVSSHGFLGFAIMASDTLGDALSLAIRYARTRTLMADIRFVQEDDTAIIQINRLAAMPTTFSFIVQNIMSTFIGISRFLMQNNDELTAVVKFTDKPQRPAALYESLIGLPVMFEQSHNQLCLPSYLLDAPVSTANAIARRLAEKECQKQLLALDKGQDLVSLVRHHLIQLRAFPTLAVMAQRLGSSPRTLNRQLAQLNTTYQKIVEEVRRELAIDRLMHSDLTVEAIAQELGYNDPSNFGRAFKRWLDMSPRQFRQKSQSDSADFDLPKITSLTR